MKNSLNQKFNYSSLIKYSAPATIMLVFMSFYQLADGVFVSNLIGDIALSALNVAYPAISFMIAIAIMLASGGVAIVSKNMGENEYTSAREIFTMIIVVGIIFAIVYACIINLYLDSILLFLGTNASMYPYASVYLQLLGTMGILAILQLLFQFFFVCAGKSHIGLILTILAGISNVVFDYIFMGVFHLGMAGAAYGTMIGQSIIAIGGLLYFLLYRKGTLYFVPFTFNYKSLLHICINGSSEMVSNLSYAITVYLYNIIMLELMQETGVAAITIILYTQYVLCSLFTGFSNGISPIISYQYGKQDHEQIHRLYRMARVIISVFSIFIFIVSYVCAPLLITIFTPSNSEIYALTYSGFHIFSIGFIFGGTNIFVSSLFTAFSNGKISACISFLRTFVCIVACLFILPNIWGVTGVFLAIPCAEFISFIICLCLLHKYKQTYHY